MYAQIINDKIIAIFSSPQDPEYWTNVEFLEPTDERLIAYIEKFKVRGINFGA